MMKLLVGLGNPGKSYERNRHNVGFMAVDRLHDDWNGGPWRRKFEGLVAEATIQGVRVMFLKPQTFMNESGRAVSEAAHFYKLALTDIMVIHDEIDLEPGKFRMKMGGGTGGHNGLKSITAHMRDGYRRLRIGIGHPGRKELVPAYVLRDFPKGDDSWLAPMFNAFSAEAPLLARGEDASFASKVNTRFNRARNEARVVTVERNRGIEAADRVGEAANRAARSRRSITDVRAGRPFSVLAQLLRK